MDKAIFFVKDVLILNISYNTDLIAPEDHIISGLKILQKEGFKLIVVTNQRGAAFGSFTQKDLEILYCRQPEHDGMLFKAAEQFNINLSESWLIGDMLNEVETGNRSGCRTILIDNGHEKEWYLNDKRVPDLIAKNINEAANLLLVADELLLPKDMVSMLGFS